jgi:predicted ATPase/DNA-binding SARP family transcriptional activator
MRRTVPRAAQRAVNERSTPWDTLARLSRDVEFLILGPLEARIDGRPVALGAPRQRLLLAALLLAAPAPLRWEQLVEEVWGAAPPASARHAVQVYVSRLREALGAGAIGGAPGAAYTVAAPADARHFAELTSGEPGEAQLTEALALWRGPVLADVPYDGSLRTEIARLEELRLAAREQIAERRLERGAHADALADLQALVSEHPLREHARALLMRALYTAGRQAEALEVFRAGREVMVEELGLEPGTALRDLQAAILRQDAALSAARPAARSRLPAPITPLVGREREIEELAALLRGAARLVTLTGPGGTGKTRLAVAAAAALQDDFADGAHFVDLSALRDPATVAPAIAHALELDAEADLVPQLRDRRLLLVLDNFEQVIDAAPLAGALLVEAAGVRVLATSRMRLDVYGEHEFVVDPLEPDEGIELFSSRARARDRRFVTSPAVADVVARLECLPLAIELVASRADRMSAEEMAAGLPILELASAGPRNAPDRHRALRAAIDWSLELLDEADRRRFAALGVFSGGLDAAAAAAVLDATPADLDRLADQSLLRRRRERWTMLEVLRERALELLDDAGAIRARHAAHYLELAEASEPGLKGSDQAAWGERVEGEHDNLRGALRHAEPLVALRIAAALGFFWYRHGHSAEGMDHLDRALAAAADAPPLLRGRALQALGILRSQRGDERAEPTFRDALEMFRAARDQARIGVSLNSLGVMARERGDPAGARAAFEEASDVYRAVGDRQRLADSLSNLAVVAIDQGRLGDAEALFAESIGLDRAFGNHWGVAQNLIEQSALALARDAPDDASAMLADAVRMLRELGDRVSLVIALERLAATAAVREDHTRAARLWGAATAQRDAAGEPRSAGDAAALARFLDASRAALGRARFAAASSEGAALDFDAALADGLRR